MNKNEKDFLIGLEELTRKTGIEISGCGCCGSPSLNELEKHELGFHSGYAYEDNVMWVSSSDKYDWDKYEKHIVKMVKNEY